MRSEVCRRCGAVVPKGTDENLTSDEGGAVFGQVQWSGARCGRCLWPHVRLESLDSVIQLDQVGPALGAADLSIPDTHGVAATQALIESLRDALLTRIMQLTESEPYEALAFLVNAVQNVSMQPTVAEDDYVLNLQVVYATLLRWGPVPVFSAADQPDEQFAQSLSDLAAGLIFMSKGLRDLDPQVCREARVSHGALTIAPTEAAARAWEVVLHGIETLPRDRLPRGSKDVDEVERLIYGSSITQMHRALMYPGDGLAQRITVWQRDDLRVFDVDAPDGFARGLRQYCVLNPVRWRDRAVPSFFFADSRPAARDDSDMILAAAEVDWLRYAPLMAGILDENGGDHVVGFTSPALIHRAFTRTQSALAGRLRLAEEAAVAFRAGLVKDVRVMSRQAHAGFEAETAELLADLGLVTAHGVDRLGTRPLPPGEIDVLAHTALPTGDLAVVVECKNVDLTFFKGSGVQESAATLAHASMQVVRKATWLQEHWSEVAGGLGWSLTVPLVLRIVVTRTAGFPTTADGVPVLAIYELEPFVSELITLPRERWWPVVQEQALP
jgi:hypothetical protein